MSDKNKLIEDFYKIKVKELILTIRENKKAIIEFGKLLKNVVTKKLEINGLRENEKIDMKINSITKEIDELLDDLEKIAYE